MRQGAQAAACGRGRQHLRVRAAAVGTTSTVTVKSAGHANLQGTVRKVNEDRFAVQVRGSSIAEL